MCYWGRKIDLEKKNDYFPSQDLFCFSQREALLGLESVDFPVFGKLSLESAGKEHFSWSSKQPLQESDDGCHMVKIVDCALQVAM